MPNNPFVVLPEDEYFHARDENPWWNESSWFSFMVPERRLNGWVYFYHRPNMNHSVGGIAIWDTTGDQIYNCLFYDWHMHEFPTGAEMFDFTLANGLSVQCVEPLKSYEFTYKGGSADFPSDGCDLQLTWKAFMPPHPTGFPAGVDEWAVSKPTHSHYEQGGRMQGVIHVGSDEILVDCWSVRDHSWGPRQPLRNPRGGFPWAIASETSAFVAFAIAEGSDVRAADRVVGGWYLKDGEIARLVSGTRSVTERSGDGRPMREIVDATDAFGRRLQAEGHSKNALCWPGYWLFEWWCLASWQFDGQETWGEFQDYWPAQEARSFLREFKRSG